MKLITSIIYLTIAVSPEVPPPTECDDVEDLGGPDVKAELPPHLSITKDVMERCIHLLSDPSLRLRLKVLSVVRCSEKGVFVFIRITHLPS